MTIPAKQGLGALTEREKQTLRLIVRGHDAKSIARTLGLSVHTINERLRDARRKVSVSSSREAARLLFEAEGSIVAPDPQSHGDAEIGDASRQPQVESGAAPIPGAGRRRRFWMKIGAVLMLPALALLAVATLAQVDLPPASSSVAAETPKPAVVDAARRFVMLVDQSRWDASYAATGAAFRKQNTVKAWATASEQVRAQFGAMTARTFLSEETVAAPPRGFEVVKFRTTFANRPETIETVTLDREHGEWRVVGITIG